MAKPCNMLLLISCFYHTIEHQWQRGYIPQYNISQLKMRRQYAMIFNRQRISG